MVQWVDQGSPKAEFSDSQSFSEADFTETSHSPFPWHLGSEISLREEDPGKEERQRPTSDSAQEEFSGVAPLAQGGCAQQLRMSQTRASGQLGP